MGRWLLPDIAGKDAGAEYGHLLSIGLRCDLPLTDEPWGQTRFGVTDPSGMWVDIVEQTEPQDGWWALLVLPGPLDQADGLEELHVLDHGLPGYR